MTASIMIIDDSQLVRRQVANCLQAAGYVVLQATDGVNAIEVLRASGGVGLIVCDVNMPRMNGLELLEWLANEGSGVPVVMLTTEGQSEPIRRAKDLGAKAWIHKPFNPELLLAAVKKLVPLGVTP